MIRPVACGLCAMAVLSAGGRLMGQDQVLVVGWNRDGSGDFGRDCRPPLTFNGEKGTGVRWKAPLPNWSNSSPIVIEPAEEGRQERW